MTPIFIPHTIKVKCIINEGVKYCENQDLDLSVIGYTLLGIASIFTYILFVFWLDNKYDNDLIIPIGFLAPLFIGGLILII